MTSAAYDATVTTCIMSVSVETVTSSKDFDVSLCGNTDVARVTDATLTLYANTSGSWYMY